MKSLHDHDWNHRLWQVNCQATVGLIEKGMDENFLVNFFMHFQLAINCNYPLILNSATSNL